MIKKSLSLAKMTLTSYNDEICQIDERFRTRLKKIIEQQKPKAPTLTTAARAERRRLAFEAKMEKMFGKDWRDKDKPSEGYDRLLKNAIKNSVRHKQPFLSFFSKSQWKAPHISSLNDPLDCDFRTEKTIIQNKSEGRNSRQSKSQSGGFTLMRSGGGGVESEPSFAPAKRFVLKFPNWKASEGKSCFGFCGYLDEPIKPD